YRSLRSARLLPVPLFALWFASGQDSVSGRTGQVPQTTFAGGASAVAAAVPRAVLPQSVQAFLLPGWPQGRLGEPFAARRLADAERCERQALARGVGG